MIEFLPSKKEPSSPLNYSVNILFCKPVVKKMSPHGPARSHFPQAGQNIMRGTKDIADDDRIPYHHWMIRIILDDPKGRGKLT
jgi:hypothetical protein